MNSTPSALIMLETEIGGAGGAKSANSKLISSSEKCDSPSESHRAACTEMVPILLCPDVPLCLCHGATPFRYGLNRGSQDMYYSKGRNI
jgi:hypothetical protein